MVTEKCVEVQDLGDDEYLIVIKFSPTVPHCSLATLIGGCKDKENVQLTAGHVCTRLCHFHSGDFGT